MLKKNLVVLAIAGAVGSAWISLADASSSPASSAPAPSNCIRIDGGDHTTCTLGGSRAGDLSYRLPALTPNDCIRINGGDYNACNVGNSGRGDLPYKPLG
jgi:hypothetical protein